MKSVLFCTYGTRASEMSRRSFSIEQSTVCCCENEFCRLLWNRCRICEILGKIETHAWIIMDVLRDVVHAIIPRRHCDTRNLISFEKISEVAEDTTQGRLKIPLNTVPKACLRIVSSWLKDNALRNMASLIIRIVLPLNNVLELNRTRRRVLLLLTLPTKAPRIKFHSSKRNKRSRVPCNFETSRSNRAAARWFRDDVPVFERWFTCHNRVRIRALIFVRIFLSFEWHNTNMKK